MNRLRSGPGRSIAFVIFQAGAQADGGLNSISELVGEVVAENRVLIFTNEETPFCERWRALGCEVQLMSMSESRFHQGETSRGGRAGRFLTRIANNLRLARRLKTERVDIVHANDARSFWSVIGAARLVGLPVILNVRDALPPSYVRAPLRWRLAYALCDMFLVLSKDMETYWAGMLGVAAGKKLRHLYSVVRTDPGADGPEVRRRLRVELGLADDAYIIAYVASFHPKKQQAAFITQAAPLILGQMSRSKIVFVGDFEPDSNPAAHQAQAAAAALDAGDRLSFAGFSREPWRWYVAADLVVLASEREGLPRCLIEAMCYGAPFASFAVSSAEELAAQYAAGSIVPLNDYEGLARAVAERGTCSTADEEQRVARAMAARRLFDREAARRGYRSIADQLAKRAAA